MQGTRRKPPGFAEPRVDMMPDAANIKPLTALRFFAAFWVVLYHYWPNLSAAAIRPTPARVTRCSG